MGCGGKRNLSCRIALFLPYAERLQAPVRPAKNGNAIRNRSGPHFMILRHPRMDLNPGYRHGKTGMRGPERFAMTATSTRALF